MYWFHQYSLQSLSASPRRSSGVMPRTADEPVEEVVETETEQLWRWGSGGPRTATVAAAAAGGGGGGCEGEEVVVAGFAKSACGCCRCWSGAGDCWRTTSSTSWLQLMVLAELADRQWRCDLGRASTVVVEAMVVVVVVMVLVLVLVLVVLILSLDGGIESALTKRTAASSCRGMPRALRATRRATPHLSVAGSQGCFEAEHVLAGQAAVYDSVRLRGIQSVYEGKLLRWGVLDGRRSEYAFLR